MFFFFKMVSGSRRLVKLATKSDDDADRGLRFLSRVDETAIDSIMQVKMANHNNYNTRHES